MQITTNYGLKKPEGTDVVDIQNFNDNADMIDGKLKDHDTQLSDLTYQTATGTATAIILTTQTLITGYAKTFIASASNSGSATTINGKPLYKPGTSTAPNLIAGKAYTVWYNSTGGCFFIKASAEGNTIPSHVLAGDTFSNDNDTGLPGAMPNNGALSSALNCGGSFAIPLGYTSGGTITANSLSSQTVASATASQILLNITAWINGTKVTGSMPNHTGADSVANSIIGTSGRIYVRPQYGYYDGSVASYVDDGNFYAQNIVSGKSIFGLAGSYDPLTLVAGDGTIYNDSTVLDDNTHNAGYVLGKSCTCYNHGGTVRVKYTTTVSSTSETMYTQLYVNGSARGTARSNSAQTDVTYTEDITVNPGDVVQIYFYLRTSAYHGYIKNFKICCGNNYGMF